jgi:hypothetical protein
MKNIKTLAVVTFLGVAISGFALAQVHRGGAFGHGHRTDAASIVLHFGEYFPKIASFDANRDGRLDAAEKASLAQAIADGTLPFPDHTPPNGRKPSAETMLNHIAEMYGHVAQFDMNNDGALDTTEQAALKNAIEKGEFAPFGEHQHHDGGNYH